MDCTSFASLDFVYERSGGSGILEKGGAADPRIVLWAMVRGLKLESFRDRENAAAAGCAAMQMVRYARSGQAVSTLAAFLGPGDRRVMRLVAPAWRDLLNGQRLRDEERAFEDGLAAALGEMVQVQARLRHPALRQHAYGVALADPNDGAPALFERLGMLSAKAMEELHAYALDRPPLIRGLVRHFPEQTREPLESMAREMRQRGASASRWPCSGTTSIVVLRMRLATVRQQVLQLERRLAWARTDAWAAREELRRTQQSQMPDEAARAALREADAVLARLSAELDAERATARGIKARLTELMRPLEQASTDCYTSLAGSPESFAATLGLPLDAVRA